jgi:hypothetical protein
LAKLHQALRDTSKFDAFRDEIDSYRNGGMIGYNSDNGGVLMKLNLDIESKIYKIINYDGVSTNNLGLVSSIL